MGSDAHRSTLTALEEPRPFVAAGSDRASVDRVGGAGRPDYVAVAVAEDSTCPLRNKDFAVPGEREIPRDFEVLDDHLNGKLGFGARRGRLPFGIITGPRRLVVGHGEVV